MCETWLIHMWVMTHSYVRHDSFICETWLIHMRDKTLSYGRHDSFICETWLIHMWDMTHSYVRQDSFICETWIPHAIIRVTCLTWMSPVIYRSVLWIVHVTHMNEACHVWMSHIKFRWVVSHVKESYHVWMSHVTCEWVVSHLDASCHICTNHVTHMDNSFRTKKMDESCAMPSILACLTPSSGFRLFCFTFYFWSPVLLACLPV